MSTAFHRARADYASKVHSRGPDHPETITARQRMQEESVVAAVKKALDNSPPLSDELRECIIAMLS